MPDRDWFHDFALVTRQMTLLVAQVNSCILSTHVGIKVLAAFGIEARPQAVTVEAYNYEGYRLAHIDVTPMSEWPDSAWSVGIQGTGVSDRDHKAWDGHLVLVVKHEQSRGRTVIDLTADQLDRPERGIVVGGPVFMDVPPGTLWTPQDPLGTIVGEGTKTPTILRYRPLVKAGDWRSSPDWVAEPDEFVAMAVRALADMRPDGPAPQILKNEEAS